MSSFANKSSRLIIISTILWIVLFGAFCFVLGAKIQQNIDNSDQIETNVQQVGEQQNTKTDSQNNNQDNNNSNQQNQ